MRDYGPNRTLRGENIFRSRSPRAKTKYFLFIIATVVVVVIGSIFNFGSREQCESTAALKYGICLKKKDIGKFFYDPCLPHGHQVVKTFFPFGMQQIPNRRSPLSKSVERHRFLCLVLPAILQRQYSPAQYDVTNTSELSYKGLHSVRAVRVLAFAPQNEESIAWTFERHLVHRPVDYVRADISPTIARLHDGIVINAENIPFPSISRVLKDDGFAILVSPIVYGRSRTHENPGCISRECRMKEFGQYDHVRLLGEDIVNVTKRHFPTVSYGSMYDFFKKWHGDLGFLFRNPEYRGGVETYLFGFKSSNLLWLEEVF